MLILGSLEDLFCVACAMVGRFLCLIVAGFGVSGFAQLGEVLSLLAKETFRS